MKTTSLVAIALVTLGILTFAYYGVTYTTREKVVDIGSLHVTSEKTHQVPIVPILGGIALVTGAVLLITGVKKGLV